MVEDRRFDVAWEAWRCASWRQARVCGGSARWPARWGWGAAAFGLHVARVRRSARGVACADAIGAGASLHVFEFARVPTPTARPMFERGRIDHFALGAADTETFERLRADLVARGSTDGTVTDFGVIRVLTFTDPTGTPLSSHTGWAASTQRISTCQGPRTRSGRRSARPPHLLFSSARPAILKSPRCRLTDVSD